MRAKLKKDTMIETPDTLKGVFRLRTTEVSHAQRLQHAIHDKTSPDEIIQTSYNFLRDLPATLKKDDVKNSLKEKLLNVLEERGITGAQELQVLILLDMFFSHAVPNKSQKEFICTLSNVEDTVNSIEIIAIKKKALALIREFRKDWTELF